jgi:uncharacterized protein YcnI
MKIRSALAVTAAVAAAVPAAASAHVTVHPNALPSGGFTDLGVRVPNERDGARTTRVDVKLPPGFIFVSYQPMPGWTTKVLYRKLAKPVTVFGEQHTQEVDRVVWSSRVGIGKGQFVELPLSVAVPAAKSGTVLTFKALQTYSNGEIVRWIGSPSADAPAPQVLVRSKDAAVADYPAGLPAARKSSSARLGGAAIGLALAAAGLAVLKRSGARRRAPAPPRAGG